MTAKSAAFFAFLGFPFPEYTVLFVGSIEIICGLLLLLGFMTRLASLPLILLLIVAYLTAHIDAVQNIYDDPLNFINQAPFMYLFVCLILFAFGAGRVSVDAFLRHRRLNKQ